MKPKAAVLYFTSINQREKDEFAAQCKTLERYYGDEVDFLPPAPIGSKLPDEADAVVFPQLVGEAFSQKAALGAIDLPVLALTSQFGTVEMWDWEIIAYLRDTVGMTVFSPYNVDLAKSIFRAIACKKAMRNGVRFLMFQDSPGEGMQDNIFKRFFWWEKQCTEIMEKTFGLNIIYKSYKELCDKARLIGDGEAKEAVPEWSIPMEGVSEKSFLKAIKFYLAAKNTINETGGVAGVGANCLNESFNSETTPCLAWNLLYERDGVLWACEGDTLTLVSKYIIYSTLRQPIMMTNIYPFLMGMAALKHEKIDRFPDIPNPDNHALGVHCGYFGLAPQSFCESWTLRPKVLEIVNNDALMADCRFATGPVTLAKLHPDMKKLTAIKCEIPDYVQYPGSDCRNGALIHYMNDNGHEIMDALSSHHALIIRGDHIPALACAAKVFGFELQTF